MGFISFFKTQKPRGFEFQPRYYDPQKEEREQRIARIKAELNIEEDGQKLDPKVRIRLAMEERRNRTSYTQESSSQNKRIIMIVLALCLILYYLLKSI